MTATTLPRHRKPKRPSLLARWRAWRKEQTSRQVATGELVSFGMWLDRLRGIPPLAGTGIRLAALRAAISRAQAPAPDVVHHEDGLVTDAFNVLPEAELPCEPMYPLTDDGRFGEHLRSGQYEHETGWLTAITD